MMSFKKYPAANYTLRLIDAYEIDNLNIWDDVVSPKITGFDNFVESFNRRYLLYEIGFKSWAEFKHYVLDKYYSLENKYAKLQMVYDEALAADPLIDNKVIVNNIINNQTDSINTNRFADTPNTKVVNPLDDVLTNMSDSDFSNTGLTESDYTSSGFSKQQLELANNYAKQYLDIIDSFVGEFKQMFMMVL